MNYNCRFYSKYEYLSNLTIVLCFGLISSTIQNLKFDFKNKNFEHFCLVIFVG